MNPIYLENSRPKHQDCTQSPAILNRRICLYIKNIFILLQPPLVELNCWAISKEKHTKNLQLRFIFFVSSFLAFSSGRYSNLRCSQWIAFVITKMKYCVFA